MVAAALIVIFYYAPMPALQSEKELAGFGTESVAVNSPNGARVLSGVVYVASTSAQLVQGFQGASSFGNCNGKATAAARCVGMIFVNPSNQIFCFWMNDTSIPLLQVWISSNGTVVHTYEATPESTNITCSFGSFVLETSSDTKIDIGDIVSQSSSLTT